MKVTELSAEITQYFAKIPNWERNIRDEVVPVLKKLWENKPLKASELQLFIKPAEVAAVWSIVNRDTVRARYVRSVEESGRLGEPAIRTVRMNMYTVEQVKDIRIEPGRRGRKPEGEQKYPSWSPQYRQERKRERSQSNKEEEAA